MSYNVMYLLRSLGSHTFKLMRVKIRKTGEYIGLMGNWIRKKNALFGYYLAMYFLAGVSIK